MQTIKTIKCVVVGDDEGCLADDKWISESLKTLTLTTYTNNAFPSDYIPTVFDDHDMDVVVDGNLIKLYLCDTSKQENYDRLRTLSYSGANVFILLFSLASDTSFENVSSKWYPEINLEYPNIPIILAGEGLNFRNNAAIRERAGINNIITYDQGLTKAKEIGAYKYMEYSVFTQEGLKELFNEAVRAGMPPSPKMTKTENRPSIFDEIKSSQENSHLSEKESPSEQEETKHGHCVLL